MISLIPVLLFYHLLIGKGDLSTTTIKDYLVAESINSNIDPQIVLSIAKCESGFKQFDAKGNPLMSSTHDVGLMQINKSHWKQAKDLGLDIFNSPVDNMEMAKIIYQSEGFKAWSCYKPVPNDS